MHQGCWHPPYIMSPPMRSALSNTVTSCPILFNWSAAARPAGPLPTMATWAGRQQATPQGSQPRQWLDIRLRSCTIWEALYQQAPTHLAAGALLGWAGYHPPLLKCLQVNIASQAQGTEVRMSSLPTCHRVCAQAHQIIACPQLSWLPSPQPDTRPYTPTYSPTCQPPVSQSTPSLPCQ
jgi:hypothetical protein